MYKFKAKPISNSFWIIQNENKKVGQLTHNNNGYSININGYTGEFKHKSDLDMIEFVDVIKPNVIESKIVHGYPTDCNAYNALWNLKYKLPLFTTTEKSKSWHAAGYYIININNTDQIQFCPKLITLQRNHYSGPFNEKPKLMFDKLYNTVDDS